MCSILKCLAFFEEEIGEKEIRIFNKDEKVEFLFLLFNLFLLSVRSRAKFWLYHGNQTDRFFLKEKNTIINMHINA